MSAPIANQIARALEALVDQSQQGRHEIRRDPEGQAQRPVPVVGEDPVVSATQRHAGRDLDRFVARPADLEIRETLVLELDLLVVQTPRETHRAVHAQQLRSRESGVLVSQGGCGGTG